MKKDAFRYQAVEQHILSLIDSGALLPGDRLPSLRSLSQRMKVSIATVSQGYLELEKRSVIEARERSGFFVRAGHLKMPPPARSPRLSMVPTLGNRSELIQTVLGAVGDRALLPFGVIAPVPELLPCRELTRMMAREVRDHAGEALCYETIEGHPELRRQIAARSIDAGFSVSPEEIVITSGAMEALYIALRSVTRPGDNVLIQSPTYYCFLQLLENCGLRAIEIPSHPDTGVCPEDVERALAKFDIRACIFAPNFNNPDGSLTSEEAKEQIVELLADREIPLVEDDVSGDLYFGERRPGTYKAHDSKGLVILCSSFSKTLAPGFRVGWMIPGIFHRKALDIKATTNVASPTPTQMAVASYLQAGHYDRHLKGLRAAVEKQMQTMQLHIGRVFPDGTRMTRPKGGAVLWLELPQRIDSVEYFLRARKAGIGIAPGAIFSTQDRYSNFIRLSCGGVWSEELREGIETLGRIAEEMLL